MSANADRWEQHKMKSVARMALEPGMVLGEDVEYQGNVLFPAETEINEAIIDRLKRYSIMCVTIKEDIDFATTHYEKIRFDESFKNFRQKHAENLIRYKHLIKSFVTEGIQIPDQELLGVYEEMASTYDSGTTLLDYLYNLVPNEDELTYTHCLNSALLGGTFADWMELNEEDKKTLILSCFYYDIGKLKLPYELLWKSGKLSEEEYTLVKKHPVIGYAILNNTSSVSQRIKNAVIMHHERMDGSGYPYHMKGSKIDVFARYVAIIDTYIAMASPRSYRIALTPLQILDNFQKNLTVFDTEILLPLMKRIADAQIGTTVQLSDDSVWDVFMIHPDGYSLPVLKNQADEIMDLRKNPQLKIVKNL